MVFSLPQHVCSVNHTSCFLLLEKKSEVSFYQMTAACYTTLLTSSSNILTWICNVLATTFTLSPCFHLVILKDIAQVFKWHFSPNVSTWSHLVFLCKKCQSQSMYERKLLLISHWAANHTGLAHYRQRQRAWKTRVTDLVASLNPSGMHSPFLCTGKQFITGQFISG